LTDKIRINKYDYAQIDTTRWYTLNDGETLVFGVYTFDDEFSNSFIHKKCESGNQTIEITEDDTECIEAGRYRYQVKVQDANGRIRTVKPETRFDILR
jgi:dTDP-glucose pyrophosphorylase